TTRLLAIGTEQKQSVSAIARQSPPKKAQDRLTAIRSFQFDVVKRCTEVLVNVGRQAHNFFDLSVALIFPSQQIRNSSRIVDIPPHQPRGNHWHVLAIEPCPEAEKVLMPSTGLFRALFHRLILVPVVSSKVPVSGGICKESFKFRTPESP